MFKFIKLLGGRKVFIHLILIAIVTVGFFMRRFESDPTLDFYFKIAIIYGSVNVLKVVANATGNFLTVKLGNKTTS